MRLPAGGTWLGQVQERKTIGGTIEPESAIKMNAFGSSFYPALVLSAVSSLGCLWMQPRIASIFAAPRTQQPIFANLQKTHHTQHTAASPERHAGGSTGASSARTPRTAKLVAPSPAPPLRRGSASPTRTTSAADSPVTNLSRDELAGWTCSLWKPVSTPPRG